MLNARIVLVVLAIAGIATCAAGSGRSLVLYVDDDAPPGGDGLTWPSAYNDLQDALADATTNSAISEIRVAEGKYLPDYDPSSGVHTGDITRSFWLVDGVALYGGYAGYGEPDPDERDPASYPTVLSGDLAGDDPPDGPSGEDNSLHVVVAEAVGSSTVLDGVTVSGGKTRYLGGGSPPHLGYSGAGILGRLGASPTIRHCIVTLNEAGSHYGAGDGAGIHDCDGPIANCVITDNICSGTFGGSGGGLHGCDGPITSCYIARNEATGGGGLSSCNGAISRCRIVDNDGSTDSTGGGLRDCSGSITDCVIIGNGASTGGGIGRSDATIQRCVVAGNPSYVGVGGGIHRCNGEISNTIVWGNHDKLGVPQISQSSMPRYCCIEDWPGGGEGNITADPLVTSNGHLAQGSPCINAGDPAFVVTAGEMDVDGDTRVQHCRLDIGADETPYFPDCNSTGVSDTCEVLGGTSADDNSNDVPDECEITGKDCNSNGVDDGFDVSGDTSPDCNANIVPDACDIVGATSVDCNTNGIPDECMWLEADCNSNGIPDECIVLEADCNGNEVPDECDLAGGTSRDCNGNSVPDACDIVGATSMDCNTNDVPDECAEAEMDCNDDGVPDECEIAAGTSRDCNTNGIPDECDWWLEPAAVRPLWPVMLNANADTDSGDDTSPSVTTDGAGNWIAVWGSFDSLGGTIGRDYDILFARSVDQGATWTYPAPLNSNADTDSGMDSSPQVTVDSSGTWITVWWSNSSLDGSMGADEDILFSRSTDQGATWSYPAPLNANAETDSGADRYPHVATDASGTWVVVWYSYDSLDGTIGIDADILFSRSTDQGATWSYPAPLNANADSDSGYDWFPQATTDSAGTWVVVWWTDDSLGGTIGADEDVIFARSTDNGATWTIPEPLNGNASADSGDDRVPQLITDGSGHWLAVWQSDDDLDGTVGTDRDILFARSTDQGMTWSYPAPANPNASFDSGKDYSPHVITDGSGNWVAAWASNDGLGGIVGVDYDILFARSTDGGTTWSYPVPLNANADSDSGDDARPHVATDDSGNWVAVWRSDDSLNGQVGADRDVFFTRFGLGTSLDCNSNAVPDECESINAGDFDNDGDVDLADLDGLVVCLRGPGAAPMPFAPQCRAMCLDAFDTDHDGDVDLRDFQAHQRTFGTVCWEDADCSDKLFCTGIETCASGHCQPGTSPCTNPQFLLCDEQDDFCYGAPTYAEGFESYACGGDPTDWLDTAADSSLTEDDSLFSIACLADTKAMSTASTGINIHSHYIGPHSHAWYTYRYTGRVMIADEDGGIGVTVLSDYPNSDAYYCLRRFQWGAGQSFHLYSHGTTITGGTTHTGLVPAAGQWYLFEIEAKDTGTRTNIRAKVWAEGTSKPSSWMAECYDSSDTRRTMGTIGLWSMEDGAKYWDDLAAEPMD